MAKAAREAEQLRQKVQETEARDRAAFASRVAAIADDERRHAEAARDLAERQAALHTARAEIERARRAMSELRVSHECDSAALRQRADAVAAEERKLQAQADEVAKAAREAERLRQKVEADKSSLARQYPPVPWYWVHKDLSPPHCERMPTRFMTPQFEVLLRSTLLARHQRGCGDAPGLARATVTRVERVENTVLWNNYGHRKATMLQLSRGSRPAPVPVPDHEVIDANVNEVFLFHGTSADVAKTIARHGFDEHVGDLRGR